MKTTATNRKLRLLITGIRSGALIPRPEFQRRLVWALRHKIYFIETVLRGLPFPEIYVAAGEVNPLSAEGNEMLVDGQQRISTLYEYFTGSEALPLPASLKPYCDLSETAQVRFLEYDVVVRDLGRLSLEEIREVFTRINSTNYALNPMEINNARYDGEFKKFGEEILNDPFFASNNIFKPADVRRMNDLRFALTLIVTIMSSYFNRDDALITYLDRYNDVFPEREAVKTELIELFSFMGECRFEPKSRIWRKPDLFSVLVELHRLLIREELDLEQNDVRRRLTGFFDMVDAATDQELLPEEVLVYYSASIQATNDRGSRILRGEILNRVIQGKLLHPLLI